MLKKINLKNKTALITGAGKGLGKACAIALAEAGAKVIILSRTKSDLDKVSKIIRKTKGSSKTFVCDVTQLEEVKKILQKKNDFFECYQECYLIFLVGLLLLLLVIHSFFFHDPNHKGYLHTS